MGLIHLHNHSTYSFLDGYGTCDQIVERVVELGHTACALTDHGNVFGHVPFHKAVKKSGVKPIYGCEFYIVDNVSERTKIQESLGASAYPHITVLARTQEGYANLLALSRVSWIDHFYYKPRIDLDTLAKFQSGLVVLSGCPGGYPTRLLESKGPDEAIRWLEELRKRVEWSFIELIPEPGFATSERVSGVLVSIAAELGMTAVMTADGHFPRAEDHAAQDLMLCVGIRKTLADTTRELRLPAYQYICSEQELRERAWAVMPNTDRGVVQWAIDNSAWIADKCEVEIPRARSVAFPNLNAGETAGQHLWSLILGGFQRRGVTFDNKEYLDRATREFQLIAAKGFNDYMLAIIDVIQYMKAQDALVVTRGSAGGCLILWLTGASETDPILHDLSFERFYDYTREDPPDVDIDFEQGRRDEAIDYIYGLYGPENCSQIAALSKLKAKAALQDVAFAFGIPRSVYSPLSAALDSADEEVDRQLNEVTDAQALAVVQRYPQLRIIDKIVGQYRQSSVHAAGVLVSRDPLDNVVGVVLSADKRPVAAVDKKGAAELGFLKIDLLAVQALDILADAVRAIGKSMDWLYQLPLNDDLALRTGSVGFLSGVFQLAGGSAYRVAKQIGLDTFTDVAAAGALCRPGPKEWVSIYAQFKRNPGKLEEYLERYHPAVRDTIRETKGVLIYQEQVMRMARELAGLEWPQVHQLRKGVQDKEGLNPNTGPAWKAEWHQRFVGGCLTNGVSRDEAEFWWEAIQTHGAYSFNKSHTTTYALVGYWMLYMKAHYPVATYQSYLKHETDPLRMKSLIFEFQQLGGNVILLDPLLSRATFSFSVEKNALIGGFTNIKGIGPKTAERIASLGKWGFEDWETMFEAMGQANARKVRATGVMTGEWNVQELIALAPWFPVPATGVDELALKHQWRLVSIGDLPAGQKSDDDVPVAGYVVATAFKPDRIHFLIEDETGVLNCKLAAATVPVAGEKFRTLREADYVAVIGWWTGDVMIAKDFVVMVRGNKNGA